MTIEGATHRFEPPFLVIATQNPIEHEGTYPLPEAQLDRFLLRTAFGYPSREGEVDVLARRIERESDDVELEPVIDRDTLLAMQAAIESVHVAQSVARVLRRPRDRDPRLAERRRRREPARQPGPAQALPLSGSVARPRLRPAGRRQGHRRPRARASPRAPSRAVGPAGHRRGRRARGPRQRPDPCRRGRPAARAPVRRTGNPRLLGYAALAALGMVGALALRRPELAIVAGPFALVLVAGTRGGDAGCRGRGRARQPSGRSRAMKIEAVVSVRASRPRGPRSSSCSSSRMAWKRWRGKRLAACAYEAGEQRDLQPFVLRCTTLGHLRRRAAWGSVRARDASPAR